MFKILIKLIKEFKTNLAFLTLNFFYRIASWCHVNLFIYFLGTSPHLLLCLMLLMKNASSYFKAVLKYFWFKRNDLVKVFWLNGVQNFASFKSNVFGIQNQSHFLFSKNQNSFLKSIMQGIKNSKTSEIQNRFFSLFPHIQWKCKLIYPGWMYKQSS